MPKRRSPSKTLKGFQRSRTSNKAGMPKRGTQSRLRNARRPKSASGGRGY